MAQVSSEERAFSIDSTIIMRIQVPTKDFVIRINKTKILQERNLIKLPVGVYRVEIWTPHYNFIDTTIVLDGDVKYVNVIPNFEYNLDYLRYNREATRYDEQKLAYIGLPAMGTALATSSAIYFFYAARNSRENANEAYEKWLGANQVEKDSYMRSYERFRSDFNRQRIYNYGSWIAAGVGVYYLYKGFQWYSKNNGPIFTPPPIPFEQISLDYNYNFGQPTTTLGIKIPLGK